MFRFGFKSLSLENVITPASGAAAGIGMLVTPWINAIYGEGRNDIIYALYFVILMDWITGVSAALKHKTYTSDYGIHGVFRTLVILMFPALANVLDLAMATPGFLFHGVTFALIYHTFKSMTANAFRAGWGKWIPKQMVDFVSSEIKAKAHRGMSLKEENKQKRSC